MSRLMQRHLPFLMAALPLAIVVMVAVIGSGALDPAWTGAGTVAFGPAPVVADVQRVIWVTAPTAGDLDAVTNATWAGGEPDAGYGLVIRGDDATWWVGVGPAPGTVWLAKEGGARLTTDLPWQAWPHVAPDVNELWFQRTGDEAAIRVNRELLWQGPAPDGALTVGVWVESFTAQPTTFDPITVTIHRPDP